MQHRKIRILWPSSPWTWRGSSSHYFLFAQRLTDFRNQERHRSHIAGRVDTVHAMLGLEMGKALFDNRHSVGREYVWPGGGTAIRLFLAISCWKERTHSIGTESAAFRKLTRRDAVKSGLGAKGSLEARMFFATSSRRDCVMTALKASAVGIGVTDILS